MKGWDILISSLIKKETKDKMQKLKEYQKEHIKSQNEQANKEEKEEHVEANEIKANEIKDEPSKEEIDQSLKRKNKIMEMIKKKKRWKIYKNQAPILFALKLV